MCTAYLPSISLGSYRQFCPCYDFTGIAWVSQCRRGAVSTYFSRESTEYAKKHFCDFAVDPTLHCGWSSILAKNRRGGEIHTSRETRMLHDTQRVSGAHRASRGLRVPRDAYVPPACTRNLAPPRATRTLLPIHSSKQLCLNFDVLKVGLLKTISILTLGSRMETWVLASELLAIGLCVPVMESDTCWH